MRSSISDAKRANAVQDTASERWSRLYADVRASYGRAAIQAAILLNGGASVALLAFLGNLAIAQQTKGVTGNFVTAGVIIQSFLKAAADRSLGD